MTQDVAFNLRWTPTDRLDFNFDAQYVDAELNNYDVEVGQYSFANVTLDASGGRPEITSARPDQHQPVGRRPLRTPTTIATTMRWITSRTATGPRSPCAPTGSTRSTRPGSNSLHFGGRYSDRDQTVRYSAFNWGNIVNNWNIGANQYPYWNIDSHTPSGAFTGYPTGLYDVQKFGGSFFGGSSKYVFFDMDAAGRITAPTC